MEPKITKNRTLIFGIVLGFSYYVALCFFTLTIYLSTGLHIPVVFIASRPLSIVLCFVLPLVIILLPLALLLFFRKTFTKLALISFLVFIGSVGIFFVINLVFTQHLKKFDVEQWKNHQQIRYLMIDDIEEEHEFVGMTRDEIIGILGIPDDPFREYNPNDDRLWYFVETKLFMKIKYYVIELQDDVVIEKSIVEVD